MISLNVPFLSKPTIVSRAEDFLKENNLNSIPIDIELVAENNYGVDIIPFSGLKREYGIDGFPSRSCNSIYIDKYAYDQRTNRLRFTVAHELGHIVLHKQYIQQINWSSIEEWINVYNNIDDKDISFMEYQAYVFAGLVLVPRNFLQASFSDCLPSLDNRIKTAKQNDLVREDYIEHAIFLMADLLSSRFEVSKDVIEKRIKFDGLDKLIK